MALPNSSHIINTAILLSFLSMWLYTEITEDSARNDFQAELIQRISNLENRLDVVEIKKQEQEK